MALFCINNQYIKYYISVPLLCTFLLHNREHQYPSSGYISIHLNSRLVRPFSVRFYSIIEYISRYPSPVLNISIIYWSAFVPQFCVDFHSMIYKNSPAHVQYSNTKTPPNESSVARKNRKRILHQIFMSYKDKS